MFIVIESPFIDRQDGQKLEQKFPSAKFFTEGMVVHKIFLQMVCHYQTV